MGAAAHGARSIGACPGAPVVWTPDDDGHIGTI
jgi:hypothetical protein